MFQTFENIMAESCRNFGHIFGYFLNLNGLAIEERVIDWVGNVGPAPLTNSRRPARSKMKEPCLWRVHHDWSVLPCYWVLRAYDTYVVSLFLCYSERRKIEREPSLPAHGGLARPGKALACTLSHGGLDWVEFWHALHRMGGRVRAENWWTWPDSASAGQAGQSFDQRDFAWHSGPD